MASSPVIAMNASTTFERYWRRADDAAFALALQAARDSVAAFADVTQASGSLLQSWIAGRDVVEFDHYPPDDVVDRRRGSQFYYHAHRDGDLEHGHLHLFCHATAGGKRRYLRPGRGWGRTAPSHLLAISLDTRGLPVALFTVNRWVTDGHWFDVPTTMAFIDRFVLGDVDGHELSCRWLTTFVHMYRPVIAVLLHQRDRCLARRTDKVAALADHHLEVLSMLPVNWAADLDTMEALASRRRP